MKYKLIEADDAQELEKKVNKKLAKGWRLYGNPIRKEDWYVAQAVVKGKE